ncbi:2Fe-2S iron-sulfur cluster-binding protein [Marmoricola sp. RAF53]|uniref:2Fe-2S iron-sulfur cluster-binding protein n=1 Tax=Marmoricola sp. RAF53 TaxID=3233059 RepID=UPI003F9A6EAF
MSAPAAEPLSALPEHGPAFHRLVVTELRELTDDAVAVRLAVPEDLRAAYGYQPGQHVAVGVPGDEERRSYSLCGLPGEDDLRIGVRRLPGGRFSHGVLDTLRPGDALEVMTPAGRFGAGLPGLVRPAFVAAGSGITPALAMAAAALADETVEEVTVLACNRTQASVMFLEELAALKNRYPSRLQLVHLLTREAQESALLSGRLDPERLAAVRAALVGPVDGWFLCGPQSMVTELRAALLADGVPTGAVHVELFHAETAAPPPVPDAPATGTLATVRLAGLVGEVTVRPGEVVLDALLRVRPDAPYACKGGVCGTCRARVVRGEVVMGATWALEPDEIEAGYVLTCQSHPTGETLEVDYDA